MNSDFTAEGAERTAKAAKDAEVYIKTFRNIRDSSSFLEGGADIAQRPVVVDVPVRKGHVVVFANNRVWRGETIGSYFLVFNTLLNWDSLNAGRKLDVR